MNMKSFASIALCATLLAGVTAPVYHADARGSGGSRSSFSSVRTSSHSAFSLGSSRSGSGISKPFAPSASPSPRSSSIWGGSSVSDSGRQRYKEITASTRSQPARNTETAAAPSSPAPAYRPGGYVPYQAPSRPAPTYSEPTPRYAQAPAPAPSTVIVHDHGSSDSFLPGFIIGSMMGHENAEAEERRRDREDRDRYQTQQAQVPSQSVQSQGAPGASIPNPANASPIAPTVNTSAAIAPTYTASTQQAPHKSHTFFWFIVFVFGAGTVVVLIFVFRRSKDSNPTGFAGVASHMVDNAKESFSSPNKAQEFMPDNAVNPFNVSMNSDTASTVTLNDMVKMMSLSGNFPDLEKTTFTVSAYSIISLKSPIELVHSGLSLERIYLDDGSLFIQTTLQNGKVVSNSLFSTIMNENLNGDQVSEVLQGGNSNVPQIGALKQVFKSEKDGSDIIFDRLTGGSDANASIEADEQITTSDGNVIDRELTFGMYSNTQGRTEELMMPSVSYTDDTGANYVNSIGFNLPDNSVTVIK